MKKDNLFYWLFIFFNIAAILSINLIFNFSIKTAVWFLITFGIVVIATFLIAYLLSLLPTKFYEPNNKIFNVNKHEKNFYEKLKIKKWKNKIPELGKQLSGFDKSTLVDPKNKDYIYKFLMENCKGSFLHMISIVYTFICAPILIFISPYPFFLSMFIPIAIVAIISHTLPLMVLRYTRFKLLVLYKNLLRKESEEEK